LEQLSSSNSGDNTRHCTMRQSGIDHCHSTPVRSFRMAGRKTRLAADWRARCMHRVQETTVLDR
jgi:hypothetical protein